MLRKTALIVSTVLAVVGTRPLSSQLADQSKTGYVVEYKIFLQTNPMAGSSDSGDARVYLSVLISSKPDKAVDTTRFILIRNISSTVDNTTGGSDTWAVTYATASAAIIAALEDAFVHEKKVKVTGFPVVTGPRAQMMGGLPFSLIKSVTLTALE